MSRHSPPWRAPVSDDGSVGVELRVRNQVLGQQAVVVVVRRAEGVGDDAPLGGVP